MEILCRLGHIVVVLTQHALVHYAGPIVIRFPRLRRRLPPTDLSKPERLRVLLEALGGSFVKLGQMLALQPDILPFEYCHALYRLLDRVKPVPAEEIEAVFYEEIGKWPNQVFDSFDRQPIASGSIGQVHVAMLAGRKVAVKIQRPDTQAGFHRDVKLMRAVVWIIVHLHLTFLGWMVDPLDEFAAWIMEELDFRREARYMKQLRANSVNNRRQTVPAAAREYTTRRVLVVEFLEGISLLDHLRLLENGHPQHQARLSSIGFDCDEFARALIDNFLGDALRGGIFHADLHPGNILILPDNVVGYIDFGITGVISRFSRQNLVGLTLAYAHRDMEQLCGRFFDVSTFDDQSDPDGFRDGIQRLAEKWYKGNENNPTLKTTTTMVMLDMLRLSRATRIWPQRDVIKYIRSAIALDGVIRQFAPDFDVGHHLAATCRRHISWHARMSLCSHDAFINWSYATADLIQNGAFRLSSLLQSVGEPRGAQKSMADHEGSRLASFGRTLQLLLVAIAMAVVAATSSDSTTFGWNLFTVQMLVLGLLLAMICRQWIGLGYRRPKRADTNGCRSVHDVRYC